jgi:DNA processing protein
MDLFEAEEKSNSKNKSAFSISEKLEWLRLSRTDNVGPITFYKLIERYGTAAKALEALPELSKKGGRKKPLIAPDMSKITREYEALQKLGGDIICAGEAAYPLALAATDDAPPVLSYIGDITLARSPCFAMVGARNASLNGRKFATKLAKELGQSGQIIVSGLARGIDTSAHEGALATGTIAVVAGGIDIVYPRENTDLYEQIKQRGLIFAESPLGMEPIARHFPKRNRIVSGLSTGVVVIEATFKSGSLITARMAGEQGRDVYAVPGYPLDPRAAGPNKLIQDGAVLVTSTQDIFNAINTYGGGKSLRDYAVQAVPDLSIIEDAKCEKGIDDVRAILMENLSQLPVGVDELSRTCHISIPSMQMALLEMEIAGRLGRLPGNRVVLLDE